MSKRKYNILYTRRYKIGSSESKIKLTGIVCTDSNTYIWLEKSVPSETATMVNHTIKKYSTGNNQHILYILNVITKFLC